jgi:hypothetical protein
MTKRIAVDMPQIPRLTRADPLTAPAADSDAELDQAAELGTEAPVGHPVLDSVQLARSWQPSEP